MKIVKKIIETIFTLCISFTMIIPVFATTETSLKTSELTPNIVKNKSNILGYLISDGYNSTAKDLLTTNLTNPNEGSINIFGNNGTDWYETAFIYSNPSPYELTGLFPVLAVGNLNDVKNANISDHRAKHTRLKATDDNTKLFGYYGGTVESPEITMEVIPEYVLEEQYIKLNFVLNNNTATTQTVQFGAYTDIQINGNDTGTSAMFSSDLDGNGFRLAKQGNNSINYILKVPSSDTYIKDYVSDVSLMWIGDKGTSIPETNEYNRMFELNSTSYSDTGSDDAAMTFAWINQEIPANGKLTKSILIGVGPIVTVTGQETYNLDESKDVIVNGTLSDPSLQTGESNQLYYSVNGGTAKKLGEPKTDKYTDYEINLKDVEELKQCSDNNVKVWVADKDDATKIISNVAEHNFKLTSSACTGEQKQTGINISYIIITTVICGGIIAFVYSKKHSKFPQV